MNRKGIFATPKGAYVVGILSVVAIAAVGIKSVPIVTRNVVIRFTDTPRKINQVAQQLTQLAFNDPKQFLNKYQHPDVTYTIYTARDWWGEPLRMRYSEASGNTSSGEKAYRLIVYSCGANRLDEKGTEDDISSIATVIALPSEPD